MNYFAHSQVPNLDFALLCADNVLQFEVSVDDAHLVKIFDSIDQRSKNSPQFLLRKRLLLHSPLSYNLNREGSTFDISPLEAYSITM